MQSVASIAEGNVAHTQTMTTVALTVIAVTLTAAGHTPSTALVSVASDLTPRINWGECGTHLGNAPVAMVIAVATIAVAAVTVTSIAAIVMADR